MKSSDALKIGMALGRVSGAVDEWNEGAHKRAKNGQFAKTEGEAESKPTKKMSSLEAFKENARQFNEALQEAKKRNAHVVEFKRIDGKIEKRYWNGARYEDRPSSMYENSNPKYKTSGTYKAEFRMSE